MKAEEFATLQVGMYITDTKKAAVSQVCSDFYLVTGFKKGGLVLQPLCNDGSIDSSKVPFWVSYKDITITRKMHASDFCSTIAIG